MRLTTVLFLLIFFLLSLFLSALNDTLYEHNLHRQRTLKYFHTEGEGSQEETSSPSRSPLLSNPSRLVLLHSPFPPLSSPSPLSFCTIDNYRGDIVQAKKFSNDNGKNDINKNNTPDDNDTQIENQSQSNNIDENNNANVTFSSDLQGDGTEENNSLLPHNDNDNQKESPSPSSSPPLPHHSDSYTYDDIGSTISLSNILFSPLSAFPLGFSLYKSFLDGNEMLQKKENEWKKIHKIVYENQHKQKHYETTEETMEFGDSNNENNNNNNENDLDDINLTLEKFLEKVKNQTKIHQQIENKNDENDNPKDSANNNIQNGNGENQVSSLHPSPPSPLLSSPSIHSPIAKLRQPSILSHLSSDPRIHYSKTVLLTSKYNSPSTLILFLLSPMKSSSEENSTTSHPVAFPSPILTIYTRNISSFSSHFDLMEKISSSAAASTSQQKMNSSSISSNNKTSLSSSSPSFLSLFLTDLTRSPFDFSLSVSTPSFLPTYLLPFSSFFSFVFHVVTFQIRFVVFILREIVSLFILDSHDINYILSVVTNDRSYSQSQNYGQSNSITSSPFSSSSFSSPSSSWDIHSLPLEDWNQLYSFSFPNNTIVDACDHTHSHSMSSPVYFSCSTRTYYSGSESDDELIHLVSLDLWELLSSSPHDSDSSFLVNHQHTALKGPSPITALSLSPSISPLSSSLSLSPMDSSHFLVYSRSPDTIPFRILSFSIGDFSSLKPMDLPFPHDVVKRGPHRVIHSIFTMNNETQQKHVENINDTTPLFSLPFHFYLIESSSFSSSSPFTPSPSYFVTHFSSSLQRQSLTWFKPTRSDDVSLYIRDIESGMETQQNQPIVDGVSSLASTFSSPFLPPTLPLSFAFSSSSLMLSSHPFITLIDYPNVDALELMNPMQQKWREKEKKERKQYSDLVSGRKKEIEREMFKRQIENEWKRREDEEGKERFSDDNLYYKQFYQSGSQSRSHATFQGQLIDSEHEQEYFGDDEDDMDMKDQYDSDSDIEVDDQMASSSSSSPFFYYDGSHFTPLSTVSPLFFSTFIHFIDSRSIEFSLSTMSSESDLVVFLCRESDMGAEWERQEKERRERKKMTKKFRGGGRGRGRGRGNGNTGNGMWEGEEEEEDDDIILNSARSVRKSDIIVLQRYKMLSDSNSSSSSVEWTPWSVLHDLRLPEYLKEFDVVNIHIVPNTKRNPISSEPGGLGKGQGEEKEKEKEMDDNQEENEKEREKERNADDHSEKEKKSENIADDSDSSSSKIETPTPSFFSPPPSFSSISYSPPSSHHTIVMTMERGVVIAWEL